MRKIIQYHFVFEIVVTPNFRDWESCVSFFQWWLKLLLESLASTFHSSGILKISNWDCDFWRNMPKPCKYSMYSKNCTWYLEKGTGLSHAFIWSLTQNGSKHGIEYSPWTEVVVSDLVQGYAFCLDRLKNHLSQVIEIVYPDEKNPHVYSGHANWFTRMVEDGNQMSVNI